MRFAYNSDIGKRRLTNQDRACVLVNDCGQLFGIVCDGMGGHLAGEHAADMAINIMCQSFMENTYFSNEEQGIAWIVQTIEKANQQIYEDSLLHAEHEGMGTTMVAVLFMNDSMIIAHVGDSRAYLYDGSSLLQLTKDHTYVNLLVESGSINKEQAKVHPQKNILMKAVGVFKELVVSHQIVPRSQGILCLCSDGLYNCLEENEMTEILVQPLSLEEKVMLMIQSANDHGGTDNISVVLIEDEGGAGHE